MNRHKTRPRILPFVAPKPNTPARDGRIDDDDASAQLGRVADALKAYGVLEGAKVSTNVWRALLQLIDEISGDERFAEPSA